MKYFLIAVVWIGLSLSLFSGRIYASHLDVDRASDPKRFWYGIASSVACCVIFTALVLVYMK